MDEVIKYLQVLIREVKTEKEKKLLNRAIVVCAAYDPKCHYCRWHRSEEWFSGCNHPNHMEYDGTFGYFCKDFKPRGDKK